MIVILSLPIKIMSSKSKFPFRGQGLFSPQGGYSVLALAASIILPKKIDKRPLPPSPSPKEREKYFKSLINKLASTSTTSFE
jgi:hypothetical protein